MAQLPPLISFTAGSPAVAGDVNQNFTDIRNHLNGANVDTENIATTLLSRSGGPILNLSQLTENQIAFNVENSQTNTAVSISQLALLATGKSILKLSETVAQTQGDAQLFLSLQSLSTIPAILVRHGGTDTFKLTKNSLNLFNDSTKVSSDRIKLPVKTTAQRNALVAPDEASVLYNTDTNQVNIKRSDTWVPIEVPVGCVQMYVMSTAPEGWLVCDGTEYLKSAYPKLNTVLSNSNTYPYGETNGSGGVGTTHFRVPDMRRRVPMGAGGSVPAGAPVTTNTLGSTGGTETVTLDITQIPSHTHRWFITGSAFPPSTTNAAAASGPAQGIANTGFAVDPNTAGGGLSHSNTQPSLVLNYIIKY